MSEPVKPRTTQSGNPPADDLWDAPAPGPINPETGQHTDYWVLPEEERAKGFIRPFRHSYKHNRCGSVTTMGNAIAETYARDPSYYTATMCCACKEHFPVAEFTWVSDGSIVGS